MSEDYSSYNYNYRNNEQQRDNKRWWWVVGVIIVLLLLLAGWLVFLKNGQGEGLEETGNVDVFSLVCDQSCVSEDEYYDYEEEGEESESGDGGVSGSSSGSSRSSVSGGTSSNSITGGTSGGSTGSSGTSSSGTVSGGTSGSRSGTSSSESEEQEQKKGGVTWSSVRGTRIFSNSMYQMYKIGPGAGNSYEFKVRNDANSDVVYKMAFTEQSRVKVNMQYRLKKKGKYVIGNDDRWVESNEVRVYDNTLAVGESDTYVLDWQWAHDDENDAVAGRLADVYTLNIRLDASAEITKEGFSKL